MQSSFKFRTVFQQYLNNYLYRHPQLYKSLILNNRTLDKYRCLMLKQMRRLASRIDPFRLCPFSIYFWFLIEPYNAIGVSFISIKEIGVYWRQQMEPNETIYLTFNLLKVRLPFPLILLLLFSGSGLVIMDGVRGLLESAAESNTNRPEEASLKILDPFKLFPKMSIYYPVINGFTSIGFLTIDFRHIEISIKQVIDPNETILSLIRFVDVYAPFPLQLGVMILSVGLFLTGHINSLLEELHEELSGELRYLTK